MCGSARYVCVCAFDRCAWVHVCMSPSRRAVPAVSAGSLYCTYLVVEVERGEEPDGARDEEDAQRDQPHVAEVQGVRDGHVALQPREVGDGVEEDVDGGGPRGEERPPPPAVVLGAQLEVVQHDGDLGAGHAQDHVHEEEEAEHVVVLWGGGSRGGGGGDEVKGVGGWERGWGEREGTMGV